MTEGNPLVAGAQSQTTGVTGIGIAESATDLANGIKDGSWVEGGLGALGVGLEVLSMVIDPIGTLASYGVGWLIEHVRPLKEALDWLAGDPPVIQSFSETWANVAKEVGAIATDLNNEVNSGTAGWRGEGADTYRGNGAEQADAIAGAASLADGISTGVMIMGQVVAVVRELVRELVAELVGKLITWALEAAGTLGFATPLIAAQATTAISRAVTKISDLIRKLVKTIGNVSPRLSRVIDKLGEILQKLTRLGGKGGGGTTTPSAVHGSGPDIDVPRPPDGPTTPSGADPDLGGPGGGQDGAPPGGRGGDRVKDSVDDPKTASREPECAPGSGEPVDLATGQMFMTQYDLALPGMLPLVLRRTHFSGYRAGRAFGRSWASSLDQRIEVEPDGVFFVDDGATRLVFPAPAPGGPAVLPEEGPRWRLSLSADGVYSVTKPESGWTLTFGPGRDGTHALHTIANRCGHVIEFRHDETGAPVEVVHSGGYRAGVETARGRVVRLWLDDRAGGEITVARFGYDDRGDLVEVINSSGLPFRFDYDATGRITKWVDRNGEWYQYFYDHRGRVWHTDGSGGAVTGRWDYDSVPGATLYTNALGETTTYRLNDRRQVVELVDALGNSTRQEWDRYDRRLSRTDPLGRTTRYTYDDAGNLAAVTRPDGTRTVAEYNELGLPVVVVEPDGAVWRYGYDERGNVTHSTDPAGGHTRFTYDERGGLASVTDAAGNTRLVESDAAGLPVALTDALGNTTRYTRDQFGRITVVTDPAGNVTRQTWTIEGRLRTRTLPDGTSARWVHDPEGEQIEYIDPTGALTRTERTHFGLPAADIAPDGSRVSYEYDRELHLVAVTNEQGLVWRYAYDAAGNRIRERDFDGRLVEYRHDAAGQVVARTNAAGETTTYSYDLAGNVVERRSDDGVSSYRYDEIGRLTAAANANATVELHYDARGNVVREVVNGAAVVSEYDALGRRVRRVTPSGVESRWAFDPEGRPVGLTSGGRQMAFRYDIAGRETERLLDAGTVIAQSWDVNSRLVAQTVSTVAGAQPGHARARMLQQRRYTYRADGLVESVEDHLRGGRRFEFDATGRITRVLGARGQERFRYDPAGNIVSGETAGERAGRPWSYAGTQLMETTGIRYRYDSEGRVVMRQRKRLSSRDDTWHYTWDADNRMTGVVTPDGTRWRYLYDPLGRRVAKQRLSPDGSAVAEQTTFHWDGTVIAEQVTDTAAVAWDWDPGGYRPLTQVERARLRDAPQSWVDQRFFSLVTDVIGTTSELVDPSGVVAWRYDGTLWGQALSDLAATARTPWRFQGQYHDPETGLHYNYARYYDPATGRYCSVDPLGLGGGPNARAYASNPVNLCDPLGLIVIWGKKKCLANTDDAQTMSGWSDRPPPPPGTTRVPPEDVLKLQEEIGHPIRPNSFLDNGVPGQHYASHAEKQMAVLDPNKPVRIDLPQCKDCIDFYQKLAMHRNQAQTVIGPDGTRTFLPDGSIRFDP